MKLTFYGMTMMGVALAGLLSGCAMPPPSLPVQQPSAQSVAQPAEESQPEAAMPAKNDVPALVPTVTPDPLRAGGPTAEQTALLATLPNYGQAPELLNETWFNSEPLKLAGLRGKVVMVEFWTFGCINCQHVIPSMQQWYAKYKDQGFEIIGVHTPEFSHEKDLNNVETAIERLGVTWPVAIDNDWVTWRAYANHYWPAAYFIDKAGNIRLLKIGEGQYDYAEAVIQALLAEETPS